MKLKRFLFMVLSLVTALCLIFVFAACGETENPDTGNTGEQEEPPVPGGDGPVKPGTTTNNASEVLKNVHQHANGEWVTITDPTCTETGLMELQGCTVCASRGLENPTRVTAALGHTIVNGVCTVQGCDGKESEGLEFALNEDGKSYYVKGHGTFEGEDLVIPSTYNGKSVTKIGTYAFGATSIQSQDDAATRAEKQAELNRAANIKSLTIPETVTQVENFAFSNCKGLVSITIPDSVTEFTGYTFQYCSALTSITLPKDLKVIPSSMFAECTALTDVVMPENLEKINELAFWLCRSIKVLELPASLTYLEHSFLRCESLHEILFDGTKEEWNKVTKDGYWNYDYNASDQLVVRPMRVYCSDGAA